MSRMLRKLESPGKSLLLLCVVTCLVSGPIRAGNFGQDCSEFVRGDHNNDRIVDASDAVFLLGYVLRGGSGSIPFCLQSSDANDDGLVTIGDALAIMRFIRLGLQLPEPSCPFDTEPGPCPTGVDPTPEVVTVPDTRDSRYEFAIGSAIGFPGEEGIHVPLTLSSETEYNGFQAAFAYDALEIQVSGIFFENTVIETNDYVFAHAQNDTVGAFAVVATFADVFTPFDAGTLPAGEDMVVADVVFTVASGATPGSKPVTFVDDRFLSDQEAVDPSILPIVHNLVIRDDGEFRPLLVDSTFSVTVGFKRGDSNNDQRVDISDVIHILTFTLLGGDEPPCWQGADVNNDRRIDISDIVYLMSYLFLGSAEPSEPFPNKGPAIVGPEELPCDL